MSSWLVRSPPDQAGTKPGQGHCVVFLRKTFAQCLSPPRCINCKLNAGGNSAID